MLPRPAAKASVNEDWEFETSAFMRGTAYRNVHRLDTDSSPTGAYGPVNRAWEQTHEPPWYIDEQRYGGDVVVAGIVANDVATIDRGLRVLEWGCSNRNGMGPSIAQTHFMARRSSSRQRRTHSSSCVHRASTRRSLRVWIP